MTTAGKITLGVEIDARDLTTRLAAAVRRSVLPAIERVQRDLGKLQGEYEKTAVAAEVSGARQEAALRRVSRQAGRTAAAIRAARRAAYGGPGSGSPFGNMPTGGTNGPGARITNNTSNVTNNYYGGAPGGSGGGGPPRTGRGGYGGGGGGGGGGRYTSGPMGAAVFNGVALGLGSLPAAATLLTQVLGGVQQLAQAGLALPGIYAGVGATIGTAIMGFKGLGEAVGTLNEAINSGDAAAIETARKELEKMSPAGAAVVESLSKLTREKGPLKELQKMVQQRMLDGFAGEIDGLATKSMPMLEKGFGSIADGWNKTLKALTGSLGTDSTQGLLGRILGNTGEAQSRFAAAIDPLVKGLGTLTAAGTDALPRMATALGAVATRFSNFITAADQDGRLAKWIDQGLDGLTNLGNTFINLGKIITSITKAAGADNGGFLQWLEDATTKLADFLGSTDGQARMQRFFQEGREQIAAWAPVLRGLGETFISIYNVSKEWTAVLLPVLEQILNLINSMPGGLELFLAGLLAFKTISPFTALLGGLGTVNTELGNATSKAGGLKNALKNIGAIGGLGVGFSAFTDQQQNGVGINNTLLTTGGLAAAGFAMAGGPGAIVGAVAGLGLSIYNRIKADIDKGRAEWEAQWQANRDDPQHQEWQRQVDNKVLAPILANPAAQTQLPAQVASGQYPGFKTGPGGSILGPDGKPLPIGIGKIGGSATQMIGIDVKVNTEQVDGATEKVGVLEEFIKNLPKGVVPIDVDARPAEQKIAEFRERLARQPLTVSVGANVPSTGAVNTGIRRNSTGLGGRADGGVLPGYSPGVDNMLVPLSGGEGILIPEAVRALGGAAGIYAINSRYRSGLSRQGYADGGVHLGTGALPGPGGDAVVGLLTEIRDLLAGKNGGGPLVDTANAVDTIATSTSGTGGQQMGPFGTPLKKRGDPGYEMAAAAISALGGDPEKFLGVDPSTYVPASAALGGVGGLGLTGGVDSARYAEALRAFALSGDLSTVSGVGLNANDPVITALTSARNKKKNGLDDESIAALVDQIVGGPGYTGVLDETNSPLVKSLTRYREQLNKTGGRGTASVAGSTGVPMMSLSSGPGVTSGADGLVPAADALARALRQAYPQLTEIGGVRSDKHPDHPSGRALDIMIPGGTVRGGANPEGEALGDQIWAQLQSMGIIDPNGSLWKTDTGGDHYNHIHARIAEGMENALPGALNGMGIPGLTDSASGANPLGYSGGPVPVYIVNGPNGGIPGLDGVVGAGLGAAGGVVGNVAGDVLGAVGGLGRESWNTKGANYAALNTLVKEGNPLALAKAMGLDVEDFTRMGGAAGELTTNGGVGYDASGRMFSDTASLLDRTFTSLDAQITAMRDQIVDVIEQTNEKLQESALEPVVKAGVQSALEGLKDSVSNAIGTAMGQAAGPIIADAVSSAMPTSTSSDLSSPVTSAVKSTGGMLTKAMAYGGSVTGGVPGRDSVPALLMPGEHVLTTSDVAKMGGQGGVYAFRAALANGGAVRRFATGGGVIGNDTVGADFFGVSQVPILGTIVNLIVRVLLSVLGVEIEVRDTLDEVTNEFRSFRGDAFRAFDAQGRLLNDTSALIDRSRSSEKAAADERIRILKIVIDALIKYIIEKVIVPIGKAVANAAIQAGASAAGAAVNTQAPGAGGIVSSLISSAGQAGVDIVAEVGSDIAVSVGQVLVDLVAEGLQSLFPDLMTTLFGGDLLEFFMGPIGDLLGNLLGGIMGFFTNGIGGIFGAFGGLLAPLMEGLFMGGSLFDDGGLAYGTGLLAKNVIEPERVLNPHETQSFDRLVDAITAGGFSGNRTISISAPFTVTGGAEGGEQARDRLLDLIEAY